MNIVYICVQGNVYMEVNDIAYDSRKVKTDSVFVCIPGMERDGHDYAGQAAAKGCAVIVAEHQVPIDETITLIIVEDTREALASMSAAFFGYPSKRLKTIGITGTKGKTTIAYMIKSILDRAGIKTGLIGTIETIIGEQLIGSYNTTPESYNIQKYLYQMAEAGCKCVVMEVSSQGLKHKRVWGIEFDYGVISNIAPDHIGKNEHESFEEYMQCKSLLFEQSKLGIVNRDDANVTKALKAVRCPIIYFGRDRKSHLWAEQIHAKRFTDNLGVSFEVKGLWEFKTEVHMPGIFNVENALIAIAVCKHFNISAETINEALKSIRVKGRVQILPGTDGYTVMIDYAHNAASLKKLLETLKSYAPRRLICVFGCGGNRSKMRRYEMGEVSGTLADLSIVTSDNPRFESPMDIINDIMIGILKGKRDFLVIENRKEAIKYAIRNAHKGDIIVFAGKGHETYQEIKGKRYDYNEEQLIIDEIAASKSYERFLPEAKDVS